MGTAGAHWLFSTIIAGFSLGIAWLFPGELPAAILGWIAIAGLVYNLQTKRPILANYLSGCIAIATAFYWLPATVQDFGGFTLIPSYAVHLLFITGTSIQFVIFALIARQLSKQTTLRSLAPGLAWIASEWLWIRIFPWEHAHSQVAFLSLTQIADIGGTAFVTLLLFWLITSAVNDSIIKKLRSSTICAGLGLLLALGYGQYKINWYKNLQAPTQRVALFQANVSTEEKHDIKMFKANVDRYRRLTIDLAAQTKGSLLAIWPESVIQNWIPNKIGLARRSAELDWLPENVALLTGALTFDSQTVRYNSGLAVYQNGKVPIPYHKRVLMPFGEYMPLADTFPWIQDLNPLAAGFTAGTEQTIFEFPMKQTDKNLPVRAAPLICYEDVLPSLSREATRRGAHLLVNLTNDGWFGKTHAALQHQQIAAFRAIENGRFLLRATNTGLTSVVNPLGLTEAQLPVYSEGNIDSSVLLLEHDTIYSKYVGNFPRYIVLLLVACILVFQRFRGSESSIK